MDRHSRSTQRLMWTLFLLVVLLHLQVYYMAKAQRLLVKSQVQTNLHLSLINQSARLNAEAGILLSKAVRRAMSQMVAMTVDSLTTPTPIVPRRVGVDDSGVWRTLEYKTQRERR